MLNKIIDWLFPKRSNQCRAVFRSGDLPYNVCVREEGHHGPHTTLDDFKWNQAASDISMPSCHNSR